MSKTPKKGMSLLKYFDQTYAPDRLAVEPDWKLKSKYRMIVKRFEKWAGKPLSIKAITPETLEDFHKTILATEAKPKTAAIYTGWLRIIMEVADPERFQKSPVIRSRRIPRREGSLREVYLSELRGQLIEQGVSLARQHAHSTAINALCDFLETDVLPEEVTPEVVERFAEHLRQNRNKHAVVKAVASVRLVMRMIRPDEFPRRDGAENAAHPWAGAEEDAKVPGTLAHAYAQHYWPAKMQQKSQSTIRQYRKTLWNFQLMLGRTPLLTDLTDENAGLFLARELASDLSPYTVNQRRNCLLAFWRYCARKRLVEEWPEVDPLAEPEVIPRAWTKRQLQDLFQSMRQQPGKVAGIPAGKWWLALHQVMWDTGERIGPLLKLEWENVDLDTGDLEIQAKHRKGGKKAMLYQVKPATIASLRDIRKPNRKLVFPWPLSPSIYYRRYDDALERAGLPLGRRNKSHKMRRSFASHVEAAGGNATAAMRHDSRALTEKSYIDPRIARSAPANEVLFDIPLDDESKGGES